MTTPNYDSTNGLPFTRISDVTISYPTQGLAKVVYHTKQFLVDASGVTHFLSGTTQQVNMSINPSDATTLDIYKPATGQVIAGQSTTAAQILLDIYAAIHANQLANDAANAASAQS